MAMVMRVFSVGLRSQSLIVPYKLQRSFFCNSSNPLLVKLLRLPISQIKSTLDSQHPFTLNSFEFSWNTLVTNLSSSSPEKARLVLEWRLERKDDEIDHNQYSDLISLCANIQNVSLALRLFTSMEIMENSEGYKPNSQTYDTFVLGFSHLRDVDKMQAWFAAKKAAGFPANLQNYESVIFAFVRTKDFDSADRFYEEMISVGVMPSVCILEYVLEGLCKRRKCDRVRDFLNFLLECKFEISGNMIEKIVELYYELGKVDEMEKLLETLMELNQVGEALLRLHCGLIRLYAKLDRLDDVEYSVGRMMSQEMIFRSPDDVEKVISSYFSKEAYDRLDLFMEHIKGYYKLTRSTYDLLVAGYRRAGLTEKLDLIVKDMKLAGF
ncbi:pentatricopeptide repeat-containing protein At2g30780 isoform X2 [Hevea brasiliensis]|uniref:pentatricopeptide repeat-containing protein At2g30780 isoform X2 n=1 Tax=Hevea brasiliensis TaxID=3981 RepID=UPI0025DA4BDE|nr:pentatricopeptide repeat-containing protein At2g30780 isoform X2 [Hevea brasiliensis]